MTTISKKLLSTTMLTTAGLLAIAMNPARAQDATIPDPVAPDTTTIETPAVEETPAATEPAPWSEFDTEQGSITIDTPTDHDTNITQLTPVYSGVSSVLDIPEGYHVNIEQASANWLFVAKAAPDADPTYILGRLTADGRIVIIDRNGVFFGQNSRVDVAGIVTTTGNLTFDQLEDGKFEITDATEGKIEMHGEINVADAGLAAFVAPSVINSGTINAKVGKVAFASGEQVTLDLYGDDLIEIAVEGHNADAILANAGTINAQGGTVEISARQAKEAVDDIINVSGVINASSATVQGGKIILNGGGKGAVSVSGTLDASGKTGGGSVSVKGENVLVASTGAIDTSANDTGNGGNINIWADRNSVFFGRARSRGGATSGNGGFVEVSAGENVGYAGVVDTTAANGETGTFLIDPADIVIGTVDPGVMAFTILADFLAGGTFPVIAIDEQALANTLAYTDVNLWATNSISTLETLNLAFESYGLPVSVTDHDLYLSAPTINLLHDIYLGTGGLYVTDIAGGVSPLGFGLLPAPVGGIQTNIVNLNGTIYGFNGSTYVADQSQIGGNANEVNIWSSNAKINQGIHFADNGATVVVAPGTYNENVNVYKELTLIGANWGVDPNTGIRGPATIIDSGVGSYGTAYGFNVTASNVTIDGFDVVADGAGVILDGSGSPISNIRLSNNVISTLNIVDAYDAGIQGVNASDVLVYSNKLNVIGNDGMNFFGGSNIGLYYNLITGTDYNGISMTGVNGSQIVSNIIDNTGFDGININAGSGSNLISGNYIGTLGAAGNIGGDGIQVVDTAGIVIDNNTINNTLGNGIVVDPSPGTIVSYNQIFNAGLDGINILDSDNSSVYGNFVWAVAGDGIEINNSDNTQVVSNFVDYANANGIYVENSDNVQVLSNAIGQSSGGYINPGFGTGDGVLVSNSDNATVDGNNIATDGRGVSLLGGDSHEVSDNTIVTVSWVNGADEGIYAENTSNANIHNNEITSADSHGISVYGGSNVEVKKNHVHASTWNGINIESVSTAGVHNNLVENVYGDGIYAGNTSGLSITGNTVHDTGDDGIDVYNSAGANISTNAVGYLDHGVTPGAANNIGGDGIALIDSANSTISNNTTINVAGNGIFVDPSPNTTVDGNIVQNSGLNGIYALDSDNVDVINNYVNTSGLNGILVTDSTDNYIYNNDVYNSEIDGIHVENFGDTRIKSNTVEHSGDDGIEGVNGNYIFIGWNDVTNSGYNGGDEYGADGIHVRGVYGDDGYDWYWYGNDYAVKIIDNTVHTAADDGIEVINSESVKIADNDIKDAGAGSSYVNGDYYGADGIHVHNINGAYDEEEEYEVYAKGFGFGGYGNDPKVLIKDNTIKSTGDDGIEVVGVDGRVEIKSNDIDDAGVNRFFFSPYYAGNGDSYGADGIHVRDVYDDGDDYDYGYESFSFGGYGHGHDDKAVTITGNNIDQTGDDGIEVIDSESVKISWNDIEHAGTDSHHNGYGGDSYGADGIHVRNVHGDDIIYAVEGFGEGYGYYGDDDEYAVEIKHNNVHKTGDDGIEVAADYYDYTGRTLISRNDISYAGIENGFFGFPYYAGHGDSYGADGIHVRGVINAGDYAPAGGGEDGYHGYAADILHNTVLKTGDDGIEVINTESTLISGNNIIHAGVGFFGFPFGGDDYTGADGIHVANVYGDNGYGYPGVEGEEGDFQSYAVVIKDNNITTSDDDGIEVVESGRTLIKSNDVDNSGVGDYWWGGADDGWGGDGIHVRNVYANDYDDYYYGYDHGYDVEVIDNTVDDSADDGIEVTYNNEIRQIGKILDVYGYDYWNGQETSVGIIGNTVSDSGDDGIDVTNANYIYIDDNDVSDSGGDGITVNRDGSDGDEYGYWYWNPYEYFPNNVVITNNTVDDSDDDGIEVNGYGQIEIGNNIVTNSDDDGIIVTNLIFDSIYEEPTDEYEVFLFDPYIFYGTANVNIHDNNVDNSGSDGIQVDAFFNAYYEEGFEGDGHTNVYVTNNLVTDSGLTNDDANGLYIAGPDHGYVQVSGNTFQNNPYGARFESGLIDLTGAGNNFLGGNVGFFFNPYSFGEGGFAPLSLVDDDAPGYETSPSTSVPTNFGGTIGEQFFDGQSTYFVQLGNQAFWDFGAGEGIWLNGLNSTYVTPFGTVRPSDTGGFVSADVFAFLESRFFHLPDTGNTGIFWFGQVPFDIAEEDLFNRFAQFNGHISSLDITLLGLPAIPGSGGQNLTPEALNAIQTFAGGEEDGTFTPEELNAIEAAAGGVDPSAGPANCWGDAVSAAYGGATVNYSYETITEDTIAGAAACSAGTSL